MLLFFSFNISAICLMNIYYCFFFVLNVSVDINTTFCCAYIQSKQIVISFVESELLFIQTTNYTQFDEFLFLVDILSGHYNGNFFLIFLYSLNELFLRSISLIFFLQMSNSKLEYSLQCWVALNEYKCVDMNIFQSSVFHKNYFIVCVSFHIKFWYGWHSNDYNELITSIFRIALNYQFQQNNVYILLYFSSDFKYEIW